MPEQLAREGRCVHIWYVVGLDGVGHEGPGQGRMYRTVYKFAPTGTKKASWLAKVLEWGDRTESGLHTVKGIPTMLSRIPARVREYAGHGLLDGEMEGDD